MITRIEFDAGSVMRNEIVKDGLIPSLEDLSTGRIHDGAEARAMPFDVLDFDDD